MFFFTGEDEKEKKKRLKAEEALKKWEDSKETVESGKGKIEVLPSIFSIASYV